MANKTEYRVICDQGYGRVYARTYGSEAEAVAALKKWQREGIENSHPSLINGGDWRIDAVPAKAA